jgi:hypothetical protein
VEPTLLITTALRPPADVPYLQMTDVHRRAIATKSALYFFVSQRVTNIVIADATGSRLLTADEEREVRSTGVNIEQISYEQDAGLVRERGKGFAEGGLIDYAIGHSALLGRSDHFFKCTGKVFCRNLPQIADQLARSNLATMVWLGDWSGLDMNLPDLRFFFTSKSYFLDHLLAGYLAANDRMSRTAEMACIEVLARTLNRGSFIRPRLSGFCGAFDNQYGEPSLGDLEYGFPCLYDIRQ